MVNHGVVTVGPDVESAAVAVILLEQAARQQLLTPGFGGRATRSSEEESLSKRANIHSARMFGAAWDETGRRLRAARTDTGLITLFIAEVSSHLGVQRPFQDALGHLLQQPARTD